MISTPQGDWRFEQPETGMKFREVHPRAMEAAVFEHRMALPDLHLDCQTGWQVRLWNDICIQNPHIPSEDTETPRYFPNLVDLWRFIQTLWSWRRNGGGFVTQEEAERRANICLTGANGQKCPHNEIFAPCLGCKGFSDEMEKLTEGRRTSKDQSLHVCTACGGCKLTVKIHFPIECISVNEENLPAWCWQRKSQAEAPGA